MSIFPTAAEGLRKAEERVQRVAERLSRLPLAGDASTPEDVVDLSAEVVALLETKDSSATIAKTALETEQRILDILG